MSEKLKPKEQYSRSAVVAGFALLSRISVILIQVMFANVLPDHQADAFHLDPVIDPSASDKALHFLIGGFSKWDASYFLHIAQHGYTRPQMFAFFPLFPSLLRLVADLIIFPVQHLLSLHMSLYSCVLVAAVALNILVFCIAAVLLYHLGVHVLSCPRLAYKAALLFCINPASVFMTAAYTESLFAMLSFAGMLSIEYNKLFLSSLLFAFSGAVRSNGLISVGFLLYYFVKRNAEFMKCVLEMTQREPNRKLAVLRNRICSQYGDILRILSVLLCCLIIPVPFALFQVYSFMVICTDERDIVPFLAMYMREMPVAIVDHAPLWCRNTRPVPYMAIQSQHWNVGFLRYFEVKQVPNFLLALPMIVLCASAIRNYCKNRWSYVCMLGLLESSRVKAEQRRLGQGEPMLGVYSNKSLVYVAHLTALLVFGVTCMHVQVVTRFIASSCPVVFWYAAHLTMERSKSLQCTEECSQYPQENLLQCDDQNSSQDTHRPDIYLLFDVRNNEVILQYLRWREQSYSTQLLLGYFASYCIVGIAMHCNFLPWT